MRLALVFGWAALAAGAAWGDGLASGTLSIGHPYAFATAVGARTAAGYFSVTNAGAEDDRLLSVEAGFPRVEVHESVVDAGGVARMTPVGAVAIPAGATVTLAPQGLHVMFMGLDAPLSEGTKVPAVLVFEKAGRVPVEFSVDPRPTAEQATMPGHGAHATGN